MFDFVCECPFEMNASNPSMLYAQN